MPSPTHPPNGSPPSSTPPQVSELHPASRTITHPTALNSILNDVSAEEEARMGLAPNPPVSVSVRAAPAAQNDSEHRNGGGSIITVRSSQDSEEPSPSPVIKRRRKNRTVYVVPGVKMSKAENQIEAAPNDDGNCCTICLDPWTSSGPHQVCCMPCGHLFGYSCIREWIRGGHSRTRECPTCKTPARVKDLRYLFGLPSRLEVSDTSEIQRLRDELRREKISHETTKIKYEETKKLAKVYREQMRDLQRQVKPSVQTFGQEYNPQRQEPVDNVLLVSENQTAGGSLAVAFEEDASYLFNERVPGDSSRHRVGRADIGRPNVPMYSQYPTDKRINCIEVCRHTCRADHRHIAVASTDSSVSILTPNLQRATTLRLPGVPLSCSWLSSRPHLIAVGLISGEVLMYDVRQTSRPNHESMLSRNQGFRAVHSLEEVAVNDSNNSALLAASPHGVFGISFDGYLGVPNVYEVKGGVPDDWAPTSFTVGGNMIAVAARRRSTEGCASQEMGCSLSMHRGLVKDGDDLKFGASLGEPVYTSSQSIPFVRCGIVKGNDDYVDTMLAYPDKRALGKLSVWAYKRDVNEDVSSWKGQGVVSHSQNQSSSVADVRAAAGIMLPRFAKINGVPDGSRGVFVTVGDDVIRVFAAGRY